MKFNKHKTHESAPHHVTGTATYTDDLRSPIDLLHLYPVLSSHARAKISQIDYSRAQQVPGVVTVITPEDITGINNTCIVNLDEILLPTDEIYYHSQPIIWIVAETEAAAREGAKEVTIDYTPLEPILTIQQAIEANSFQGEPQVIQRGNPYLALDKAEYTLEGELEIGGQDHFYLETHVSWVTPDTEGNYQVYSSTQHPTETQIMVARVLGISRSQVVVTCLRMGGAFGGKESQSNPIAAIAALAAQKTGQSVRVRLKRNHDMIVTGKRHGFLGKYRVGFDLEGKISALDVDLYSHGGWSLDLSLPIMGRALFHIDNCYYIPNLAVRGNVAKTHTVSNTAFRGFGGPQAMVIIEEVIDRISRFLKSTPLEIREKNFYHGTGETNTTHYGQELFDNRLHQIWSQLKQEAQLKQRTAQVREFNQSHAYEKRGLAITPVKFGISFTKSEYNQAGALILIYLDGSIQLNHGGTEMGQGLHSKMLQVAAKSLGVNLDRFRVMPTSTDKVPNTSATAASSGSDLNGQAIKNACETLKERLAPVAAKLLNLYAPEDLVFAEDWIYSATNPNLKVSFDEVIGQAYLERISLSATGYYRTPNISWNPQTGKGRPFHYYAYGAAVSEVQVDRFTGTFKLRKVDIVHDVGNSLHPLVDRGQIEGGFVQGMGWLTMEELVWDNQGRLRTYSPSTYKIPTIADIPENFHISLLEKAEQPGVIYGSKAVGEPPFMLAISVREAIREAIAAFGDTQQVKLASPATPEAILRAIESLDCLQK
ncbi:xanthine dehydrogenase molybdopterin binding subunit [Roseofilum reptotaenium CS-1145]|uniref:Xanthine dehydrogenase molybdopterin binding subunit n=1 Tax=Roseofilum reptotaenium AO1-A TaxID=1925591 RepID=A0A1L9QJW1_9CYAN|nr:xanthine dehydrogenase molybdopterin binding subunit [Roseofilum reptotaenium]MDB9515407.1 xanthine dehydrogenase molybdopterin binding subunit [Roseofilum reptotaenium CS-1145]OJJ15115.1 xanthine dehydrogenase molybdopterin binding subunit [Roseofilum reptotaenium AO1-A]